MNTCFPPSLDRVSSTKSQKRSQFKVTQKWQGHTIPMQTIIVGASRASSPLQAAERPAAEGDIASAADPQELTAFVSHLEQCGFIEAGTRS